MKILKEKTLSVCPECYSIIPAKVKEESNMVYMEKECPQHGEFSFLVDSDASVYSRLINRDNISKIHTCVRKCFNCHIEHECREKLSNKRIKYFCCLMLPVSYACNLNCNLCYLPQRNIQNPSFAELKDIIVNFHGQKISLTGGEPTLRPDLSQIIELISKVGKIPSLATNGVRLADYSYAKMLKDIGLQTLVFSLNGFDEEVFIKIEGERLLDTKLKALENLKKLGIKVQISTTLVKGLNEKELPKIYQYCLDNLDFVTNLRIRSASAVGRFITVNFLSISELITLLSNVIGIDKQRIVNDFDRRINYSPSFVFTLMLYLIEKHNKMQIVEWDTNVRRDIYLPLRKKFLFASKYFKKEIIRKRLKKYGRNISKLWIDLISWPSRYNIDIEETKYSVLHHLTEDNCILPFNNALIENEKYLKK